MRANLPIRKTAQDLRLPPHLAEYERERQAFSWAGREMFMVAMGRGFARWQTLSTLALSLAQ